jgi:hypothetical protein
VGIALFSFRGARCQERTNSRPADDHPLAALERQYLSEVVIDPNETPTVNTKLRLKGCELILSSVKRPMRNSQRVMSSLWLDANRPAGENERIWSLSIFHIPNPIVDYTEPYAFKLCGQLEPRIGLAFLRNQFLYFTEVNIDRPPSQPADGRTTEAINLSPFVRKHFETANWEPRFTITEFAPKDGSWLITVRLRDQTTTFKRQSPNTWVELTAAAAR